MKRTPAARRMWTDPIIYRWEVTIGGVRVLFNKKPFKGMCLGIFVGYPPGTAKNRHHSAMSSRLEWESWGKRVRIIPPAARRGRGR